MNKKPQIKLGISPCPNDTFIFHALLTKKIRPSLCNLDIELLDVQQLNEQLGQGKIPVSKASFHAALHLAPQYGILPVGSALGFGVGPLLLSRSTAQTPSAESKILCPGAWTTATLLFQIFYPQAKQISHRIFSEIMDNLAAGTTDFGVVIHEGRFVFKERGFSLVADLGDLWEKSMNAPIPLGGILVKHDLPAEIRTELTELIRASLQYSYQNREEAFETMSAYSQELSPEVVWSHVELYVNEYTNNLGSVGRTALETLFQKAKDAGILEVGAVAPTIY